jgi:hypothetical protein
MSESRHAQAPRSANRFREVRADTETRPFDRVKDLLGSVASEVPDLGEAHREHLRKRFRRDG